MLNHNGIDRGSSDCCVRPLSLQSPFIAFLKSDPSLLHQTLLYRARTGAPVRVSLCALREPGSLPFTPLTSGACIIVTSASPLTLSVDTQAAVVRAWKPAYFAVLEAAAAAAAAAVATSPCRMRCRFPLCTPPTLLEA